MEPCLCAYYSPPPFVPGKRASGQLELFSVDRSDMFLADELMSSDHGNDPDTDKDVNFKCSCNLNYGQPCHSR